MVTASPCHHGAVRERGSKGECTDVRGGARVSGKSIGVRAWTWSTFWASMGSYMNHVCKVLDQMA